MLRSSLRGSLLVAGLGWVLSCSAQTVLNPGDLAIVGINANNGGCSGVTAQDEISFFCFKSILPNTRIWLTDCSYEKLNAGQWGDGEGVIQLMRNGAAPTLAANTVITIRANNTGGAGNVTLITPAADVANWTITSLNGGSAFNLNSGGDQVFFIQPNTAPAGTFNNPGGADNATFPNCRILYGFSTVAPPNDWVSFQNLTTRSGVPPGMICFSMAPSAGTDFIKYIGPAGFTFPAYPTYSQRQWIIDIDDQTRWTSYASCAAYNTAGPTSPNYVGGFTFPVAAGGFVNGRWTGAKSTDWFDCRNWDDAEVPINTSDVVIDPTYSAGINCVIGVNPSPPTAYAKTVTVSSPGITKTLTIQNSGVLQVAGVAGTGGVVRVQKTMVNAPSGVIMTGGSLTADSLTLTGLAPGQAFFRNESGTNTVQINGNIKINPGGNLDLQGVGVGGTVSLTGNFTNHADAAIGFEEVNSNVSFNGTGPQSINTLGGFTEDFGSIYMNKSSGDLTLNAPITIRSLLNFNIGRIMTSSTNLLFMSNTSTYSNAGDSPPRFIHGPMVKVGMTSFTFPVGKGIISHPVSITSVTAGINDAFIAEYFPANPNVDIGVPFESPPLDHISSCEYWRLDQYAGTPVGKVTLQWDPNSVCGITDVPALRIAHWDGTMWRDRGGPPNMGSSVTIGSITTTAPQEIDFAPGGYWTFASLTAENPLPVELLSFTARPWNDDVLLEWMTATEMDNDHFTVERSADGVVFSEVMRVDGAGNSTSIINYAEVDRDPLPGTSFYRLKQTDHDGASSWSNVVMVRFSNGSQPLVVTHGNGTLYAMHTFPAGSALDVLDMTGRMVARVMVTTEGMQEVPTGALVPGAYVLRLSAGERVETARFAY